jgi:hypothetical protein
MTGVAPRSGLLALAWGLWGCALGHGEFTRGVPAPPEDSVAIVVLGGAGAHGPAARPTAQAVTAVIDAARTAERDAVVVLPGDYAPHRRARRRSARADRGAAVPVVDAAIAATPRVGTRFALPGWAERGHGRGRITPTPSSVVRIGADGRGTTISRCDAAACRLDTEAPPGLVDLVLLDLEPWRVPGKDDTTVRRTDALLDAVAAQPEAVPRVLVVSIPIEGAFEAGQGVQFGPAATFHMLPPSLQRHLAAGVFVGIVAGGERSVHLTADLTEAIQRSDRVWLRRPVWQVVSGNASNPSAGRVLRRTVWNNSVALRPERSSFRPGFAVVRVDATTVTIDLLVRRRGHWEATRAELPLRPADAPPRGPTRALDFCLRCDDEPAGERP